MQTVDENYEDIWSEFDSGFEDREAKPLSLNIPDPPSRQRTIDVANLQSLFSGYYPALLICLIAGLAGVANWEHGLLVSTTCFSAFLLAAIFAPTLRGARRAWGYYALTGLLIGGAVELSVAASESLAGWVFPHFAPSMFTISLQEQMESFYRLDHWALYLGLGIGVAFLTFRLRKRAPWMDSPRTGALHKLLAAVLLAVPLLLPLGCFILGRLDSERTNWYLGTALSNPDTLQSKRLDPARREVWTRLHTDWLRSTRNPGGRSRELFKATSVEELHKVEREYLELTQSRAPKRGWTSWQRESIQSLLLARKNELEKPFEVARSLLRNTMLDHRYGGSSTEIAQQWQFLLETLQTRQLDKIEGRDFLKELETYDQNSQSLIGELDNYVLAIAAQHSPFGGGVTPEPMTLFGVPFHHSPSQLYFLYHTDYVTKDWLKLRDRLIGLSLEQQLALVRQQKGSEIAVLDWMSVRTYDHELRPLWRAAAIITASKLYRLEQGSWPEQTSDLDSLLWFEPEVRLAQTPEGLHIQDTSSDQSWVLK